MVHVEHILLAEFDIERGASLAWEYPTATGTRKETLAELMLPDGAHNRTDDWTLFFLNQRQAGCSAKPLLFCLNYIGTRRDASVRRGAVMKALAVCSKHQFVQVFKPPILLALNMYLENPSLAVLAYVYNAINAMDLSGLPDLSTSERLILRNADIWASEVMEHKLHTEAILDSMLLSPLPNPSVSENKLSTAITAPHIMRKLSWSSQNAASSNLFTMTKIKDWHYFETTIPWEDKNKNRIALKAKIPLIYVGTSEEVGEFDVRKLVTTFSTTPHPLTPPFFPELHSNGAQTPPVILLLNALIMHKRVLFIGYNRPSKEVAEFVLAACAIASGSLLRGFTERAFPYTCLANVDDILACPGYIAGVTNPFFEQKTQWWDVCCNIVTGKILVSPSYKCSTALEIRDKNANANSRNVDALAALTAGAVRGRSHKSSFMESLTERWRGHNTNESPPNSTLGSIIIEESQTTLNDQKSETVASPLTMSMSTPARRRQSNDEDRALSRSHNASPSRSKSLNAQSTNTYSDNSLIRPYTIATAGSIQLSHLPIRRGSSQKLDQSLNSGEQMKRLPNLTSKKDKIYEVEFIAEIQAHIQNHAGDLLVRLLFHEYIERFVRAAASYELDYYNHTSIGYTRPAIVRVNDQLEKLGFGAVWVDENMHRKEMEILTPLIEAWRGTGSYQSYRVDFQDRLRRSSFGDVDILHQLLLLRNAYYIAPSQLLILYHGLVKYVCSDEHMNEFLSYLPLNRGGLITVANGLLHPDRPVRDICTQFLTTVQYHTIGAVYVRRLPYFLRKTFEHQIKTIS